MTPDSSSSALMRILSFDSDDLKHNQQGQISFQQRIRLLQHIDPMPAFFMGIGLIGFILGIGTQAPDQMLVLLVIFAIGAFMGRSTTLKIIPDVLLGQVSEMSGKLTVRTYKHKPQTFMGLPQRLDYATGTVNDLTFAVPLEMGTHFPGTTLRIFYTPRFRLVISGEVLPD
jgi:hypothetical protein